MSEAVQIALIANGTTVVLLILSHVLNRATLKKAAAQIEKVEVATNSIKDALVLKTEQEAHARGRAEGYEQGHVEGRVQGLKDGRGD